MAAKPMAVARRLRNQWASTAVVAGEMNQRGASPARPGDLPGRTGARAALDVSR